MSAVEARRLALRDVEEAARRRAEAQAILARSRAPCGAALVAALGPEAAAFALGLTPAAVTRVASGSASARRRLHARLCERLGLSEATVAPVLANLPRTEPGLARAAFAFAVTLEITGAPRVLAREAYRDLVARYGEAATAFALDRRARLRAAPDAGSGTAPAEEIAARAAARLVETLAAAGHPAAGPVAARLCEPMPDDPPRWSADPARLGIALEALAAGRAAEDAALGPAEPASGLASA